MRKVIGVIVGLIGEKVVIVNYTLPRMAFAVLYNGTIKICVNGQQFRKDIRV